MATQEFAGLTLRIERSTGEYRVTEAGDTAGYPLGTEEALSCLTAQEGSHPELLSSTFFQGDLLARWQGIREAARSAGSPLRLQIDLEGAEELDDLPWEILADPGEGDLSLLRGILPPASPVRTAASTGPLCVLAVVASPADLPPFDADRAWEDLEGALGELTGSGRVELEHLVNASESDLRLALARRPFRVVHFIGYGRSNLRARYGSVFLEGRDGRSRAITAEYLADLVGRQPGAETLVLQVGGSAAEPNPFAETARILVRKGLRSVVALRRRLTGAAMVDFDRELYTALASGLTIESGLLKARRALRKRANEMDWEAPMLYVPLAESAPLEISVPAKPENIILDVIPVPLAPEPSSPSSSKLQSQRPRPPINSAAAKKRAAKTKILVLAASPENMTQLRVDRELRDIRNGLRKAKFRERFHIESCQAVRPLDLQQALLDYQPHIVHFCGHGNAADGLILEDDNGLARPVPTSALVDLFGLFADKVECVVLNSCHSEAQAEAIAEHISYVIGMERQIEDRAAINFAVGFYVALGAGQSIEFAFELGCNSIELEAPPGQPKPVLYGASDRNVATG